MLDGALALCLLICCKCAAIPHKAGPSPNHNQVICIEFSVAISCVSTCLCHQIAGHQTNTFAIDATSWLEVKAPAGELVGALRHLNTASLSS